MKETSKALIRRLHDSRYATRYFRGLGIDIGAGPDSLGIYFQQFPLMTGLRAWDLPDGDAQLMQGVDDDSFDFVHSSHCLEHLRDPAEGFSNWIRICRPGGHIITTVPDEDLYEQGVWPSNFNTDHKTSWTIAKRISWSPASVNVVDFLSGFRSQIEIVGINLVDASYIYDINRVDQTYHSISECAIEFIVRKRTAEEITRRGRLPRPE